MAHKVRGKIDLVRTCAPPLDYAWKEMQNFMEVLEEEPWTQEHEQEARLREIIGDELSCERKILALLVMSHGSRSRRVQEDSRAQKAMFEEYMQLERKRAVHPQEVEEWDEVVAAWVRDGSNPETCPRLLRGVMLMMEKNIEDALRKKWKGRFVGLAPQMVDALRRIVHERLLHIVPSSPAPPRAG